MPDTSTELWELITESRLVPQHEIAQLREAFSRRHPSRPEEPAERLARWLLRQGTITRYHARVLLSGRSGPFFFGGYQVRDRIAAGRLRGAFRAIHRPTGHPVLLQLVHHGQDVTPQQLGELRRKVEVDSRLVDPLLQRVFLLETVRPYHFLVLEDLHGQTLRKRLTDNHKVSLEQACHSAWSVARALAYLHKQAATHAQLCPRNIWLTADNHVKLVRDSAVLPSLRGSVPAADAANVELADYQAPEGHDAGGRGPSPQADIYGLGCVLYEMLAGTPPFSGGDASLKAHRHATDPIPSFDQPSIPTALSELVTHMLAKNPALRVASMDTVVSQLEPFVSAAAREQSLPPPTPALISFERVVATAAQLTTPPPAVVGPAFPTHPPAPELATAARVAAAMAGALDNAADSDPGVDIVDRQEVVTEPSAAVIRAAPTQPRAAQRLRNQQQTRRRRLAAVTILIIVVIAAGFGGHFFWRQYVDQHAVIPRRSQHAQDRSTVDVTHNARTGQTPDGAVIQGDYAVVADDGRTLWMTPTLGKPLDLRYILPAAQCILVAKPAQWQQTDEGPRVLQALGPDVAQTLQQWEHVAGVPLSEVDNITISLSVADLDSVATLFVLRTTHPMKRDTLLAAWGKPPATNFQNATLYTGASWTYCLPAESPTTIVFGDHQAVQDWIRLSGAVPPLRAPIVRLLQHSDDQRHLTIAFVPQFVRTYLAGASSETESSPGHTALAAADGALAETTRAVMLSLHLGGNCYVELRSYGSTKADAAVLRGHLQQQLDTLPDRIEAYFQTAYPAPFWRRIALRLPEMVRFSVGHARVATEDGQLVANAVLPGSAAHNLIFAAIMLAQPAQEGTAAAPPTDGQTTPPLSLEALLSQHMTLAFDQQSLEFAMRDLEQEIRSSLPALSFPFAIKILGNDLQLSGITRNQQITSFSASNQTIAEILTTLVMKANPITTVRSAHDVEQKLVWVIGPAPDDRSKSVILITTRQAAAAHGYSLPAAFVPEQ